MARDSQTISDGTTSRHRLVPQIIGAIIVAVLMLLCTTFHHEPPNVSLPPVPSPPLPPPLPEDEAREYTEILRSSDVLPFEGEPVRPIVRPDVEMPIQRKLFLHTELFIDDQEIRESPIKLKCSAEIRLKALVHRHPNLFPGVSIAGEGVGLACKSSNEAGWVIKHYKVLSSRIDPWCAEMEVKWNVPAEPGEYLLLIFANAHAGGDHPIRIAGEYPVALE